METLNKEDFKCYEIRKQEDGLFKPIYKNKLVQHCYGWGAEENKMVIKPSTNDNLSDTMHQFNFWLRVFHTLTESGGNHGFLYFNSLLDYNNFVDEVFRLIDRYPKFYFMYTKYTLHNDSGKIIDYKDLPKGVIQIQDLDSRVEFLKLDDPTYIRHGVEFKKDFPTLSQYKIEEVSHLYQDGLYILDMSEMKMKPNPKFFKDGVAILN